MDMVIAICNHIFSYLCPRIVIEYNYFIYN